MAYYTGSANDFDALRTALLNACVAEGWTQVSTDILTKGDAVVQLTISLTSSTSGVGILAQGATSLDGSTLVNPSAATPRMGPPHQTVSPPTWPMTYHIHIFDEPDEVYFIANFNVAYYYWLAFGLSDIAVPGSGLWITAVSRGGQGPVSFSGGINISPTVGGNNFLSDASAGAAMWGTGGTSPQNVSQTMHLALDGLDWWGVSSATSNPGGINASLGVSNILNASPSEWNGEAILIPILPLARRESNKSSLVAEFRNARYIRVDNYNPGQIITLGGDQWKVYPFYRKDSSNRDGGSRVDHTGTFGWAIRYDGA